MDVKKIAFLINSLTNGGAERVLSTVVSSLKKEGYQVELICLEKDDFYSVDDSVKVTYLTQNNGKENFIKKFIMLLVLGYRLKKYIQKNNIEIVQSHLFRANYVNVFAKIFGSNHQVQLVSAVSALAKYGGSGISSKINLFLINSLYKYADLLIFKANAMRDEYLKFFNLETKSIIINNPIDIEKINLLKNDDKEVVFKFDKEKKYIVSMGRFHKDKRQIDLIEAFRIIEKKYNNLEILFLGDGEQRANLEELVREYKLSNKIHFLGSVKNPFYYLNNSYMYISTSTSEGFPNALLEAMCCGLPVISTDCKTGPREILDPKYDTQKGYLKKDLEVVKYGILIPENNLSKIKEAIEFYLDNNTYNSFKIKVHQRVVEFSKDKIIEKYKKVLEIE